MLSVSKFHARTGRLGQPLDNPYDVFDVRNVRFRYGATSMIAGKPGSYKSILALNLLTRWVEAGYSALYFSADSDERTVASRLASISTGTPWTRVDADFENRVYEPYQDALGAYGFVRFEYRVLEMEEITDRLNTFEAITTTYPDIVFLDNLINFAPSTDDWGYMRDMTNGLDTLARETKSHICVLHHASEATSFVWDAELGKSRPRNTADPVPRSAIQGKITQIPRLVLTTAANDQAMAVCCVKNTNGPQDPDAKRPMLFEVGDNLRVTDDYRNAI